MTLIGEREGSSWPQANSLRKLKDEERRAFLGLVLPPPPPTSDTEFASDEPRLEFDTLNRAPLAFTMAHKINEIWTEQNVERQHRYAHWFARLLYGTKQKKNDTGSAFTLHIDAPWGGGKTTFAN